MRFLKILFCVLGLSLVFAPESFAQVDKREVRAGNRKFKKDKIKEAEIDYRKAVLKDSTSVAAQYNLASALYRQNDFQGAGQALAAVKENANSADYHFNAGDVALQQKDYAGAMESFKQSLLLNPGDMEAKESYLYAKKMLENQQNQQNQDNQDQNQDQNQDNQDQNQDQQDQNQDQQNQDQDNDQNQDNQNQDQQQQPQISPQQAQQMLRAIQAKEQQTQEKVNEEKAAALESAQKEKNW